ncbi:T9SS type A sorting domain-containing protein [bacterium]|nr:T9SS type A sorting domain-containing protein [bacterium]MBU1882143.1 T9SS type A sorting domain-containing protein [bacterium]
MKTLKTVLIVLLFDSSLICYCASAQDWSAPVQVTSSAGDDHNLAFIYADPFASYRMAWDCLEAGDTDLYACEFEPWNGAFTPPVLVAGTAANERNPVFSELFDYPEWQIGLFFECDHSGYYGIYFTEETESGYSAPWLSLYSDVDLLDPVPAPMMTCLGAVPTVFIRSYNMAVNFMYGWENWFSIPQDTSFYISYPSTPDSIHSHDGYIDGSGWVTQSQKMRYVWELEFEGRSIIEYSYQIGVEGQIYPETLTGNISHTTDSFRNPQLVQTHYYDDEIFIERESPTEEDIVVSILDLEQQEWSSPEPLFEADGNERNLSIFGYNYAFETDIDGNWDVAFWHPNFDQPEIIDSHSAEDRNPVIFQESGAIYVFWESNRDGNWNIYYAYRDAVGVEPDPRPEMPQDFAVSVYPNPGNAQFEINFDLPVSTETAISIYDISGKLVQSLQSGFLTAGDKSFKWNGGEQPSGLYLVRVETGQSTQTSKLVLLK